MLKVSSFAEIQHWLNDDALEGLNEENVTHFNEALLAHWGRRTRVNKDDLLRYDNNIVYHWQRITAKRNISEGRTLQLKYFQYIALLFTEIYLDSFFRDPDALLAEINSVIDTFNRDKPDKDRVETFEASQLNKIAFWMATGSGKTLIMHCNVLQYKHYLEKHRRENEVDRVILLTPNEGLSEQHRKEFELSDIEAGIFSKQGLGSFINQERIEIIDIHKLADSGGDKTVDVAAFEGRNLVLVDEGHSGASSGSDGAWMSRRNALCENGFSFEYSATFGQAVKSSEHLTQVYAKSILFDYSYRFFYEDGYGKEYRILNMEDDTQEDKRYRYLSACLLTFYQQQKVYEQQPADMLAYLIEKPLWVFVGGSVTAVYQRNKRKVSDVLDVILFLAEFTHPNNQEKNIAIIDQFLKGKAGLLGDQDNDIFERSFEYLANLRMSAIQVFEDILKVLFNSGSSGRLFVEELKGSEGEIGLKVGENEYFGLVSVGDPRALCRLAEGQEEVIVTEQPLSTSLFHALDEQDSKINILIGSRKFMEGWNSWRVSTMGLMNIGRGEGTQIIQLFGRGVRLKGQDFSLKRSSAFNDQPPRYVPLVETLNVFGVRADYMRQFEEYLAEEGLPIKTQKLDFVMPVIPNLGTKKLKVIKVKSGIDFKQQGEKPMLELPDDQLKRKPVTMNWYPHVQAISSLSVDDIAANLNQGKFTGQHIAFLNLDQIYFALQDFKADRRWYDLNISRDNLRDLLLDGSWYQLFIPVDDMAFMNFEQVFRWQEIAIALLKKYMDRFYKYKKAEWESNHLEYQELTPDDPNFISEYHILVEQSRTEIINTLEEIKQAVESGDFRPFEYQRMSAIMFEQHLYQPLLYLGTGMDIEIKPVALNEGEKTFVEDLKKYYDESPAIFEEKELYLLRNRSRGSGVGFFEAGNFYPDFIMWIVNENI
ncbi:MAG TPA: DEAD/DEAH box helicase family protein, partial [Chloroflexi bacterium]|nr:DEAD/DEAH box helicase family protein [Chloroflexota bacterium]